LIYPSTLESSPLDVIVARNVRKTYRMGVGRAWLREMLPWPLNAATRRAFPNWWTRNTLNALQDVSFTVEGGTAVGIVGHNGAGKTTLLKVLQGVTEPSSGHVDVRVRTAALIDVLVGFHPELTGRENTYLLGSIYGISPKGMNRRIDEIMDFAEIEGQADTPLKRYSAGMQARLGFATLASLGLEALLLDEVLAVGDANFQRKCIRWIEDFHARGGTLLFVSHNLSLVRNMTERVIWLDHGKVTADGPTADVLSEYGEAMKRRDFSTTDHRVFQAAHSLVARGTHRWGAGGASVEKVDVDDHSTDDDMGLDITITYEAGLDHAVFCIGFLDEMGRDIGVTTSPAVSILDGGGEIRCRISPVPLRTGVYFPVVAILSDDGMVRDRWRLDQAIVVDRNGHHLAESFGPVDIPSSWAEVASVGAEASSQASG
jgi:ABC-type polysaccharide/polyol phosphate transport system ATPase subunit